MHTQKTKDTQVLYLGDWVFHLGPMFIETPFGVETKDADLHFYGKRLTEALEPQADVTALANWELYRLEPGKLEAMLTDSHALIISDVEAKCFHLYPSFFDRARRENKVVTFPDRLEAIKTWIRDGGGMMMLGGWLSFSGVQGKSGWGRSVLKDVLPVECLPFEDLVESSAGFTAEVLAPEHPAIKGLAWENFPPIFGYNEVKEKPEGTVLVRVKETGHPLVVAGEYGSGRTFTYMSDPAPHWGINFERWESYDAFWQQSLSWVQKKS
ncbi:glutamine amidotransferase [Compostibacter hankyongensis]|uniref:Putative glutamine amidotransferase domain-containing protein n=1 Tax=Compostibacter hankyongensis TaxID=1007089 RepID=A0ABP8G296_9BACT